MAVEDAIYSRATGHSGLSALISTRIYPGVAPQNVELPAVTYQRISSSPESLLTTDTDIVRERFQFTILSTSSSLAIAVGVQIKSAFQRWKGTEAGVIIEDSYYLNDIDLYESNTEFFQKVIDFEIVNRG